jgi:hypothetical protein
MKWKGAGPLGGAEGGYWPPPKPGPDWGGCSEDGLGEKYRCGSCCWGMLGAVYGW